MKFPSIKDVAAELVGIKRWLSPDILKDEEGCDVRLQVTEEGSWAIRSGDASYDQDHRGYWGASSLAFASNCYDLARDLLEQVKDDAAMCGQEE